MQITTTTTTINLRDGGASVGEGRSPQPLLSLEMTFPSDYLTGEKQEALIQGILKKHGLTLDDIDVRSMWIVGNTGRAHYKLKA
jgi:hypothetical protein